MSIASEITRLQGCKANIRTALVNKGITSASTHNMADFATDISNISAGGATITVTYNSSFYNKTMTCTKGSTTYTQTTTSSGSTVFNVTDEGTWTITCNGVSRTVYVTLNYSTQMATTKTITVYGAAGATISFTDAVGSKTVTLDNSGQGSASITFIPPSQSITFTDTNKAKNPNNLSQNYSKSIAVTESTTSINVMPDNALYWYGWKGSNLQSIMSANGWSFSTYTTQEPTWNTNDVTVKGANNVVKGIGVVSATSWSKFNAIYRLTSTYNASDTNVIGGYSGKNTLATEAGNIKGRSSINNTTDAYVTSETAQTNRYLALFSAGAGTSGIVISAVWLE